MATELTALVTMTEAIARVLEMHQIEPAVPVHVVRAVAGWHAAARLCRREGDCGRSQQVLDRVHLADQVGPRVQEQRDRPGAFADLHDAEP